MGRATGTNISMSVISYKTDLAGVDWAEMQATLVEDDFYDGRSPTQYQASFEQSYATCIAYTDDRIIGTVRALSDGVCSAYIVDVWTYTPFRGRGVAQTMMQMLFEQLQGQHVYLFTHDAVAFYKKLGFEEQGIGLGKVVGEWLQKR
jgi:ribosomal protein S18 acetylase RimI-like enzyme